MQDKIQFNKPAWVFSRTYDFGQKCSKTLITNTNWCADYVLDEMSSDIWHILPATFTLESLYDKLFEIGVDLKNDMHRESVYGFLMQLQQNGLLLRADGQNPPKPDTSAEQAYYLQHNEIPYVTAKFNKYLRSKNMLSSVLIELTYSCNENCVHCFNPKSTYDPSENISTEDVISAIHSLYAVGINNIFFSGGEASMRPDIFEILDETRKLNIPFSMYTNAQFDKEFALKLASYYPKMIAVSIYSANPETHDATTRRKGSFERSVGNIKELSNAGIFTSIKCPMMTHTVYGYKQILKLAESLNSVPMFNVQIRPTLDGDQITNVHQIRDKDVLTQLCLDPHLLVHVDGKQLKDNGYRRAVNDGYICASGRNILSISPNGDVFPCNCMPLRLGNIKNQSIEDIWANSEVLHAWQAVTLNFFDECGMKEECSYCRICPAESILETGKWFGKPNSFCEIARIRMSTAKRLKQDSSLKMDNDFGNDLSFRKPQECQRSCGKECPDPEDFLRVFREIQKNGNSIRMSVHAEEGSPALLNISNEEYEQESNFFDGGRR